MAAGYAELYDAARRCGYRVRLAIDGGVGVVTLVGVGGGERRILLGRRDDWDENAGRALGRLLTAGVLRG